VGFDESLLDRLTDSACYDSCLISSLYALFFSVWVTPFSFPCSQNRRENDLQPVLTVATPLLLMEAQPLTITITRVVKPGQTETFERLVKEFIPLSLTFPGHMGVHVVKPSPGISREYVVHLRFTRREQWQAFLDWPEYQQFRASIEPLLEQDPKVEELCGLETWFTIPGDTHVHKWPRWKMALLTLLAVYPTSLLLQVALVPQLSGLPWWVASFVVAACMVLLLTWVIMPNLTRVFSRWLYPQ
jgi:uncharacterized protein